MRLTISLRPAALAFAACGFALAATSALVNPGALRHAEAQTAPTATIAVDPATAGLVAATPAPPVLPPHATEIAPPPESGGSLTASLGGSDVAVSSVGGSYEVDGPKRKAKKWPRTTPTP